MSVRKVLVVSRVAFFPALLALALVAAGGSGWGPAGAGTARADAPVERQIENVERQIETDRQRAQKIEKQRRRLSAELSELRRQMIATARNLQDNEGKVSALEATLTALNMEAQEKRARLTTSRRQLAASLSVLARLARHPPEALAARPGNPHDSVRSAILLRAVLPPLTEDAAALGDDLHHLAALHDEIEEQRAAVALAARELGGERRKLARLVERKASLSEKLSSDQEKVQERVRRLAEKAKSLKDLLAQIEADRKARESRRAAATTRPSGGQSFQSARGRLPLPVEGRLVSRYGERDGYGGTSKGLRFETRSEAQVVAPFDGEVVFAREFRGYGPTLIIDHGGGYHTLLVGLFRIDSEEGQWLLAGEPVGTIAPARATGPELYVELRHHGEPINPLPWLADRGRKVRG